jgi:hypothetical protein
MALGLDAAVATFVLAEAMQDAWRDAPESADPLSVAEPSGCPMLDPIPNMDGTVAWTGAMVVAEPAGCVGHRSGAIWAGRVEGANVPLGVMLGKDPVAPTRLVFTGWSQTLDGQTQRWDGAITGDRGEPAIDAPLTTVVDLTVTAGDLVRAVHMTTHTVRTSDGGTTSTLRPGAEATLPGLGTFGLALDLVNRAEGGITGTVTLSGRDTLVIDLGDRDEEGCLAATLDGEPVDRVCPFPGTVVDEDLSRRVPAVTAFEASCAEARHDVAVTLDGAAGDVALYLGPNVLGENEWHPLAVDAVDPLRWSLSLAVTDGSSMSAGVESAVACGVGELPRLIEVWSPDSLHKACYARGQVVAELVALNCPDGVLPLP